MDSFGNIYVTFSGSRGQKTAVSVYKIDLNYNSKPFASEIMNATGLAFDKAGTLYISSRYDGIIYQATSAGNVSVYVEGMGVATGIAFDPDENLYVGDRSGTVFKISRARQIYVFATLEPSIAAYHFAFGNDGYLYVAGPTTSSFDSVNRISPAGEVETYYRGLGRPQGLAFDAEGVCMWQHRSAAAAEWFDSITIGIRSCFSPVPELWVWRSRRRAPWRFAPTTRCIVWMLASQAGLFPNVLCRTRRSSPSVRNC